MKPVTNYWGIYEEEQQRQRQPQMIPVIIKQQQQPVQNQMDNSLWSGYMADMQKGMNGSSALASDSSIGAQAGAKAPVKKEEQDTGSIIDKIKKIFSS